MRDVNTRLMEIEAAVTGGEPLMVLAEDPETGEIKTMTAKEMHERGYGFCKVVSGKRARDLSFILDTIAAT